ncbi:MAG: DUF6817 domain-containing protein, partial [Cocleimonas sp.]
LETHLKGTESILESWGASDVLRSAGLFHAAYGTAGFDENMVSLAQRQDIKNIIGDEAEALVYLYCSCDRNTVFPQFGSSDKIQFKDRFNGSLFELTTEQMRSFCELTAANELEIANDAYKAKYSKNLLTLFNGMKSHLSLKACLTYESVLGEIA